MTLSTYAANAMLDHTFGGAACPQPTAWWVQLHYGDPGVNGTANSWSSAGRVACTSWESPTYGWIRNTADIEWTALPSPGVNPNIERLTVWDANSSGNCLGIGVMAGQSTGAVHVTAGDSFLVPALYLWIQWVT